MKNTILLFLIFALAVKSFCQQNAPTNSLTKQDYLLKSKHQKTAAWVLLVGGAGMIGGGLAINLSGGILNGNGSKGLWLSYLGGAAVLGSIPFFIAAGKNKKKAMSLSASFDIRTINNITGPGLSKTNYPAVSIKLSL